MAIEVFCDGWGPEKDKFKEEYKAAKAFRNGRDLLVVSEGGRDNAIFDFHVYKSAGFTLLIQPYKAENEPYVYSRKLGYAYPGMKGKSSLLTEIAGGKLDLLMMTATFLGDAKFKESLLPCPPDYVIVDCAETLIDESCPYHRQYLKIPKLIQSFPKRPAIFANTYAWRKEDRAGICLKLGMQDWKTFAVSPGE